jgi:hypothetical protein
MKTENKHEPTLVQESNLQTPKVEEQRDATPMEKRFLKALHWMRCPGCGSKLTVQRASAVEIAVCPDCDGAWLDFAALEAITSVENDSVRTHLRDLFPHRLSFK